MNTIRSGVHTWAWLLLILGLFHLGQSPLGPSPLFAADQPNVILMMCDDLGWGDVGFNGNQSIRTPHLDAMAATSLRFERFYSAAPVCSPTRGSCLTGRHPFRYGIYSANKGHMKSQEMTVPELLGKMGYRTGHFGKWHLGTLSKTVRDSNRGGARNSMHYSPPQANGFQECFSTEAKVPTYDPMWKPKNASRSGWNAIRDRSQAVPYGTHYWDHQGQIIKDNLDGDDSRVIMDRAIPFIKKATHAKKPFFAVIWFHTPHLPVVASPKHRAMYKNRGKLKANYFGAITAMDEQVGRLRAELKKLNVSEKTMIWFASDNGPEGKSSKSAPGSAGPFRGRKRSLYEGGVRVPALLEWPGHVKPGSSTAFPVVTSDYLPTLIELVGARLESKRPMDGISLLPMLAGTMKKRPRPIGFQSAGKSAWSDNRYKLYQSKSGAIELYDLMEDPSESKNIASQHSTLVERMTKELESWKASCARSDREADYQP